MEKNQKEKKEGLGFIFLASHAVGQQHRRRIKAEEKAKVVAVVWGTYLNATLTVKHQV